ncbi:MAG: phosphatase PAP2 family protein [Acidobacteriota bacterium]
MCAKPSVKEWLLVTSAGAALGLGLAWLDTGSWIYGIGLAAAMWAVLAPLVGRRSAHPAIAFLALYPLIASTAVLTMDGHAGVTFDRYLLAADGAFGFQAGFAAARFTGSHPAVKWLCELCYFGLPVAMASLFHTSSARRLMLVSGLLAVSSLAGYAAFPAVGAQMAFGDRFPNDPPPTNASFATLVSEPGGIARNFMPSLHTAWGLALLLAAWPLGKWWRLAILVYLAPMLLETLARHYLCDIIVAVPWALSCWNIILKRWEMASAYLLTAASWMLLIRFALPLFYASPLIPWLLAAATLAMPIAMNAVPVPIRGRAAAVDQA